jgi:adenylosuccinate synthase
MRLVVALSGAVGSGKSTVARAILAHVSGQRLSTRSMIIALKEVSSVRGALQDAGDALDVETDFGWVADSVVGAPDEVVVVDAVRRAEQVERLRDRFPGRVQHVHLVVDPDLLVRRHAERQHDVVEPGTYDEVRAHPTEAGIEALAETADVVFDPSRLDEASIAAVALAGHGLLVTRSARLVDVVVGGQYGSEGKGNVCSYLAGCYAVLMRVGGPNAGHRVRKPDYDFIHLPSGALHNPDARLLIGAGATLSLEVLLREIEEVGAHGRLTVDPQAIVIEPGDVALEAGSLEVIGSTKKGVGVATARKILNRGGKPVLGDAVRLARDVPELAPYVRPAWVELERAYAAGERIMLEGTQGTDLSLHHGSWPHVTSRETTASGCMADAGIPPTRIARVLMVVRTYPIRVGGTSGNMGREIGFETVARRSGGDEASIRRTEVGTISGKPRRVAEFDLGQIRRAAALNGATEIALTFADYVDVSNADARSFAALSESTRTLIRMVEDATGIPVTLVASGPEREQMIERRQA